MILNWLIYFVGFAFQSKDEEREWMLRIQDGDKKALRMLYKRYKNLLFGLIIRILKNREEAEDCLQEVFTQLWEKSDRFDQAKGTAYSFIVTIARNKAIDKTRSRTYKDARREEKIIDDFTLTPISIENNPHENLELKERINRLRNAMTHLNENERQVLSVAYYNGLSQSEISEKMDIPLGTVKYRMRQGMIKLKERLLSMDIDE